MAFENQENLSEELSLVDEDCRLSHIRRVVGATRQAFSELVKIVMNGDVGETLSSSSNHLS